MTSNAPAPERPRLGRRWIVAAMVLVGGGMPLALYGLVSILAPAVTPAKAREMLRDPRADAVLVDVRAPETFSAGHIEGAVNWPLREVLAVRRGGDVPASLRGKTMLVVCDVGMASRWAVRHLASTGVERAVNVRGGIQEWARGVRWPAAEPWDRWRTGPDSADDFPLRPSPVAEQALAVAAFFFIKPLYTLLSLAVAVALWNRRAPDLAALRWAMIAFFLGENACAVNYFLFGETSYLAEYLHSLGMLACFGFAAFAVLEGIDRRVLLLSDPDRPCVSRRLCGRCAKDADVPCGLKRLLYALLAALMIVSLMLPAAGWRDNSYNTIVFGRPHHYAHLRIYQQFENLYCAAAAFLLFGVSLAIMAWKKDDVVAAARVSLAAALGPLGFGLLRMVLGAAYDENRVWYLFWEEATELLFIAGVCLVLWTMRRGLFPALSGP